MIRRSASPAAARGRRGGRATGLLPGFSRYGGGRSLPFAALGELAEGLGGRMSVFLSGGSRLF